MTEIRGSYNYSHRHMWVNIKNDIAICGMSDYGQAEFGEFVFIELPKLYKQYYRGHEICIVESVKSISDLYSPISGRILEVNRDLEMTPNLINSSSYDEGWIFKISIDSFQEASRLLSAESYVKLLD